MSVRATPALFERQPGLSPIQRLNLALFIDTQNQALVRWVEVQPDHIGELVQKLNISGKLEGSVQMWLEVVFLPDAVDLALADFLGPGHSSATPMSLALGFGFQGCLHNRRHFLIRVGRLAPATGGNLPNRIQTFLPKASPPQTSGVPVDRQLVGYFQILHPLSGAQHDAGTQDNLLRSVLSSN